MKNEPIYNAKRFTMAGVGKMTITPPAAGVLRVQWLLSSELGLFKEDKLDGPRFPKVIAELRGQSLVGFNQPEHNPHDMPWLSLESFNGLYKRASRFWDNFDDDTQDAINAEIDKNYEMDESKPRALRNAPQITAAQLVEGVQILLEVYPESRLWRHIDRVTAIANWWGTTVAKVEAQLESARFTVEVNELSEEIAALFWQNSDPLIARMRLERDSAIERAVTAEAALEAALGRVATEEQAAEHARAEAEAVRAEVERLRLENAQFRDRLAAVKAGVGEVEEQLEWAGGEDTCQAFTAVRQLLLSGEELWYARLEGEQTLPFDKRLELLAPHLPGGINVWRGKFGDIEFFRRFVKDSLGAAAFVGYDLNELQPADSDTLSSHIVNERVNNWIQSARAPAGSDNTIVLTWNGLINAIQPNGPQSMISTYLYYLNEWSELKSYDLLRHIGAPPMPWVYPWPLIRID